MVFAFLLAVCLVSVCVFFYFLLIKGVDRYEPEPWWLLTVCFFWGAFGATLFSIIFGGIGSVVLTSVVGQSALAKGLSATLIAPWVEESFKGVFLLIVWGASVMWLRDLDGPLDGAIYGGVIGLGFTLTEDVLYIMNATAKAGAVGFGATFVMRTIFGGLGHATFTAMTGLGVGIAAESRSTLVKIAAPVGGWFVAVGLHMLHNFLVSFFGMGGVLIKFVVFAFFILLFFVVLYALAFRDRKIVRNGLTDEVGILLGKHELDRTTSAWMLAPLGTFFLLSGSPGGYFGARKKQLALVDLSFLKHRQKRGDTSRAVSERAQALRAAVTQMNQNGVTIGKANA
jgi:RsiW-degrading membrane proteinase PrsW (M82 family)